MNSDKIPPVRFIISNWILINSISPLVFILYKLIFEDEFQFSEISFSGVFFYIGFLAYALVFSLPSFAVFGVFTVLLNQIFDKELYSKIFLIILTGPIIFFTFKTFLQDGFVKEAIPSVTLIYWFVASITILLIRMNRETNQK